MLHKKKEEVEKKPTLNLFQIGNAQTNNLLGNRVYVSHSKEFFFLCAS